MDSHTEIISKHWKSIGWIVAIFVSITVTQLILRLPNEILISEILLLILIISFIGFLILQSIKTTQDLRLINTLERIPYEIVQPIFLRKLIFDKESLTNFKCTSESFRTLRNNMVEDSVYNDFKVEIFSTDQVPKFEDITVFVNNEEVDSKHVSPQTCIICETDGDFSEPKSPKRTEISFDIPVNIESGGEKSLKILYQSEAFKSALSGQTDSITLNCARLTEKLWFEIRLNKDIRNTHRLSKCDEKDKRRGGQLEFDIEDGSNERMVPSENEIRKKKHIPSWKDDVIIWNVPNPKVNYNYTLYFTIKEKIKKT